MVIISCSLKKSANSNTKMKAKGTINRTLVYMFPENVELSYLKFSNQIIEIIYKN